MPSRWHYSRELPEKNCGAVIEARVTDFTSSGNDVDWLPLPAMVKAEVLRMRFSSSDDWRETSGRTLIKFPRDTSGILFGDVLELEGVFEMPEPSIADGGFDFKTYLVSEGVQRLFTVSQKDSITVIPGGKSFLVRTGKVIIGVRDYLMNGMSEGMELKYRKMLAAMLFGCRQGLDYGSRRQFTQSGVIHIFAISGLHVGMLGLTLYMLFCWIPFRTRHLIVPCFLFLYVLTTGMQASAMRAFLMIGIWSLHRAALKTISSLNAVFLAAVLILAWNPLNYLGAGFQYSFVIAGFLVVSWQSVKKWQTCFNEHSAWNPDYGSGFLFEWQKFKNGALSSLLSSFIAWLASSALNLLHRNLFIPGAIFANFIILPFVWLLFFTASVNIVLFPLRNILHIRVILQLLLKTINLFSAAGAEAGGGLYAAPPPYWMSAIFFICLIILSTSSKKAVFMSAAVILMLNIGCWYIYPAAGKADKIPLAIHGGESQMPSFICIPPGNIGAVAVNSGSKKRAQTILNYLNGNGINSLETLCFTGGGKESCDGAWILLSGLNVRHIIFSDDYKKSSYAKYAMQAAADSGAYIDLTRDDEKGSVKFYSSADFRIFQNPDSSFRFITEYPGMIFSGEMTQKGPGEKEIAMQLNEDMSKIRLINSNLMKFIRIPNHRK
jgi:ComEC/Rec2-related protein